MKVCKSETSTLNFGGVSASNTVASLLVFPVRLIQRSPVKFFLGVGFTDLTRINLCLMFYSFPFLCSTVSVIFSLFQNRIRHFYILPGHSELA